MFSQPLLASGSKSLRLAAILVAVVAVVYLPWLSVEPPASGLETTRILVAREMERSGNWIVPTQNGVTYLAKPPVGYWLTVLGSAPFGGVTVVSARFVSVMCMLALALSIGSFAKREIGEREGVLAGLCVLVTALCLDKGMHAELEAPFALLTTLAVLAGFRSVWSARHGLAWSIAAGLTLGAAVLTKGPLAMLVFLLAFAAMGVVTPSQRARVLSRGATALCIGTVIGALWLLGLLLDGGRAEDFERLVDETFKRVHDAGRTNREAWWYYGPALLASFLPATLLLPALVARRPLAPKGDERKHSLYALLFGWSVLGVIALSASQGKEARYLMPLIPGWSLLAAWAWFQPDPPPWLARWKLLLRRAGVALAWIAPPVLAYLGWRFVPTALPSIAVALGLSVGAFAVLRLASRTDRSVLAWSGGLLLLLALRVFWVAVPMAVRGAEYPIRQMGAEIASHLAPGEPLVQLGEFSSYVQLQVDHPFRLAPSLGDVPAEAALEPRARYVLARSTYLPAGQEGSWSEVGSWPYNKVRFRLLRLPEGPVLGSSSSRELPEWRADCTTGSRVGDFSTVPTGAGAGLLASPMCGSPALKPSSEKNPDRTAEDGIVEHCLPGSGPQ